MIKKIDANKYGVVKYVITSVDELNRLPKKIAPSSQAILIENGLRVFVYGDGQWVEEVVDRDLSENMQSIVADYERSKIGYDGVKRGSLGERLKDDFQGIYDILNARDYCEYRGGELKADNTWMGNQIDTRVEGRTLQNLIPTEWIVNSNVGGHATYNVDTKVISAICDGSYSHARFYGDSFLTLIRAGLTYTICFKTRRVGSSVDRRINLGKYDSDGNIPYIRGIRFTINEGVAQHVYSFRVLDSYKNTDGTQLRFTLDSISDGSLDVYDIVLLEGDHTQTPLSELPYFEGIESVGEREIGKNLFDGVLEVGSYDVNGTPAGGVNAVRSKNYIEIDPNKQYCISLKEYSSYFYIHCYDKDKKNIGEVSTNSTFKPLEGCKYITFNTYNGVTSDLNSPIQLEEGTQATPYEPFGYKISGKSCGKNLFDIRKWHGALYGALHGDDTPLEITEDGKVIIYAKDNDTYTRTGSGGMAICPEAQRKHLYLVHENTTYTLSMKCEGEDYAVNYIQFWDENYNSLGLEGHGTDTGFKRTFKTPMKTKFLGIRIGIKNATVGSSLCYSDFQLEENDHATPYEPYQESTYSIHSPIPLRSLPNGVCDVYDFESGAVIQKVGKVVLDGSENWLGYEWYDDDVTKWFRVDGLIKANNRFLSCISDKFICVMSPTETLTGVGGLLSISPTGNGRLNLRINKDKLSSLDVNGFKLWLQANPTTVYYELIEPIIHYLTPSQLKSFDGTTHVISENTLIPTTTTKILTDTYTNVSNVNSTAYSLRRGVNDVAETSAIINETDIEQDDVLDVTMCAIDELYSMLEPNLE